MKQTRSTAAPDASPSCKTMKQTIVSQHLLVLYPPMKYSNKIVPQYLPRFYFPVRTFAASYSEDNSLEDNTYFNYLKIILKEKGSRGKI